MRRILGIRRETKIVVEINRMLCGEHRNDRKKTRKEANGTC